MRLDIPHVKDWLPLLIGLAVVALYFWMVPPHAPGIWEDAMLKSPRKLRPYFGVAWSLYQNGEHEAVIEFVETVALPEFQDETKHDGSDPDLLRGIGEFRHIEGLAWRELGDMTMAEWAFAQGVQDAGRPENWQNMGAALYQSWLKEREINPKGFARSRMHANAHTLWVASECYARGAAEDVDTGAGYGYDGYIDTLFHDGKRYKPFARYLLELKRPLDAVEMYALGKWSYNLEDWPATAYWMSEAAKGVNWPIAPYNAAYAYQMLGNIPMAIRFYEEALRRDPMLTPAQVNLDNLKRNADEFVYRRR